MKTKDLFNQYNDLESSKKSLQEDTKNRQRSIETAEHNLKGLYKEHFENFLRPLILSLIEEGNWEKINEIFSRLDLIPVSDSGIALKTHEPKDGLPGIPKNAGPITDKNYYNEFMKFLKKELHKCVFEDITKDIALSNELGRMTGSKPALIVGLNDFDKANGVEYKTLTSYQLWKVNHIFKDKNWVDTGYYLNGSEKNFAEAEHFIEQFEKLGWAKDGVLEFPIKIDLFGLTFNGNKEGLIYLTDESIFCQTTALQNGNYLFHEVDEMGIPIKSESGNTHYTPSGEGFYRCCFYRGFVSSAWVGYLRGSNPNGLVVRELA